MATFRQLQDRVTAICALPGEDYRDQVRAVLNERRNDLANLLPINTRREAITITTVNPDGRYSVTTDFLLADVAQIRSVAFTNAADGSSALLTPTSESELDGLRLTATPPVGTTAFWWASPDSDTLVVFGDLSVGDQIILTYESRPADLTDDDDEPTELPSEFHHVLVDGACRDLCTIKNPNQAGVYDARWDAGKKRVQRWSNTRVAGGVFVPPTSSRSYWPTSRSVYPGGC